MKHIIITCGTSMINKETVPMWERDIDNYPSEFGKIFESIETNRNKVEKKDLWAEISLLDKIAEQDDMIYFFFSETEWGNLVKKVLEETSILQDETRICDKKNVFLRTISWFQNNAITFQQEALPNFFQALQNIREKTAYQEVVLCPVWGYKSLIPYASLFAMIAGWDINYLYEDAENVLDLPAIPLQLDIERIKDLSHYFTSENDTQNINNLQKSMWIYDQNELLQTYPWLLEIADEFVCLSALGRLYYTKYVELQNTEVYLSEHAKKQFDNMRGKQKENFENIFERLKNSMYREAKAHHRLDKYIRYKMGNTTERVLFYEKSLKEKTKIVICEVVLHAEYEKLSLQEDEICKKQYNDDHLFC